jgi:hypothetical protein
MSQQPINDELLLDYLWDRCEPQDARRVEAALAGDAGVVRRFQSLKSTLSPLDRWTTPEPSASMVSNILDAIAAERASRALKAASVLPSGADGDFHRPPILSLRELVALAACITIFVGVFVPSLKNARFNSRRQVCAANLASIFQGTASYAMANNDFLPYAGPAGGRAWLRQSNQQPLRNSRHFVPLVRNGHIKDLRIFICPARKGDKAATMQQLAGAEQFPDPRNISYHVQYLPGAAQIVRIHFPYVGDANPIFEDGVFRAQVDPESANSTSHQGAGQNILTFDGQVQWLDSPVIEQTGDNLWLAGSTRTYTGREAPFAITDAFLVP